MRAQILLWVSLIGYSSVSFSQIATSQSIIKNQVVFYMESNALRDVFSIRSTEQEIQICNLEPGAIYDIAVYQDEGFPVYLMNIKGGEQIKSLEFTAEEKCESFVVLLSDFNILNGAAVRVSVARIMDEKAHNPEAVISVVNESAFNLVQNVLIGGDCFDVTNITYSGHGQAKGHFTNGLTSIGLDAGVVLTTGRRSDIPGPNSATNGANWTGGCCSDPDLDQLASNDVDTRTMIEFDFTPTSDTVTFRYVFASEEYCDWVNSSFNDVFGFFISGPGINGPFSNNGINIAQLPGGAGEVSINNVNWSTNSTYYVDNVPVGQNQNSNGCTNAELNNPACCADDIEFDGFTAVMTATAVVQPCQTYHIKLAVGDVGDEQYDSAVFLEANSFNAGGQAKAQGISAVTGTNIVYESCDDLVITFQQQGGDPNLPYSVHYTIHSSSTATVGVDYVALPNPVIIPAGSNSITIPLDVFDDGIPEGQESIVLELDNPCSCNASLVEFFIEDPPPVDASLQNNTYCGPPGSITLTPTVSGGIPGTTYTYEWEDGSTNPSLTVNPTMSDTYVVTVTDDCGGQDTASATITVLTPPTASISGNLEICGEGNIQPVNIPVNFTGDPPWVFVYSIDGVPQPPITTSTNPYILTISTPSTVTLDSVEDPAGECPGTVSGQVTVSQVDITVTPTVNDVTCNGGNDGSVDVTASGGTAPYTYVWSTGDTGPSLVDVPTGTYTVTVTDVNGCEGETSAFVNEPPPPPPLNATPDDQTVCGLNPTTLAPGVSGGVSPYTYQWDDGSSGSSITVTPNGAGTITHDVTITDDCGDQTTSSVSVEFFEEPTASISGNEEICAEGDIQPVDFAINFTGNPDWEFVYAIDGVAQPPITTSSNPYILTISTPGTITLVSVGVAGESCPGTVSGQATLTEITITPSTTVTDVECNGQSTGTVEVTVSGGTPSYTYNWSNGGSGSIQNDLPTGTYTITVTDADGCEGVTSAFVNEPPPPPPLNSVPDDQTVCGLNPTTLTPSISGGVPPYTYQWDDGSSGTSITVTPNGAGTITHDVTVTDDCGDMTISSVSVEFFEEPTASISGNEEICAQGNIQPVDFVINFTGNPDWTFVYAIDGIQQPPITTSSNPYILTVTTPGSYTLVSVGVAGENCPGTVSGQATLSEITITPSATGTDETCFAESDGTVTATGGGGTNPYTFQWSNGVSGPTQTNLPTGTYVVTVTDADGCTEETAATVSGPPLLTVSANSPSAVTCSNPNGGSVTATGFGGTPGYTYNWSDGSTGANPTNVPPGVYTVTVTDVNGCTAINTTEVLDDTTPPNAAAVANGELDCINTSITVSGSGSSTGTDITYQWTGPGIVSGGNTLNPVVDQVGTYTILVTNTSNGCTAEASAQVNGDQTPPVATALGGNIDCNNPVVDLDGNGSSTGSNFIYNWSGPCIVSGQGTLNPTVCGGGTYVLTVTNTDNGCTSEAFASVSEDTNIPDAEAEADPLTCVVNQVTINGNGSSTGSDFEYEWTTVGGNIVTGGNTLNPVVDQPGTYILVVTNSTNGCSAQTQVNIPLNNTPPNAFANSSIPLTCTNTTTQILGSGSSTGPNITYNWSGPGIVGPNNVLDPTVNQPGTYTIVVTDNETGCTNSASVDVQSDTEPPEAIVADPNTIDCNFPEVTLDGSQSSGGSGFSYTWVTTNGNIVSGSNTPFPVVDAAGNYILIVLNDFNGCTASTSVDVDEDTDDPFVDAGPEQLLTCIITTTNLDGTNTPAGGNLQFEWSGPGIIGGANTLTPEVNQIGTYTLTVTNGANGCTGQDIVDVSLDSDFPSADAGPDQEINCGNPLAILDGLNSSQGNNYTYQWTTIDGNIVSGDQTATPTVDAIGTYNILVTNTINGCTEEAAVYVTDDFDFPVAQISPADIIDCSNFEIQLDALASSTNGNFTYYWTTTDGNIVSGQSWLEPTVDEPGTYTLSIFNNDNECETSAEVIVDADIVYPDALILPPATLNCAIGEVIIDATFSSTGQNLFYQWTTSDGNIVSGQNSLELTVDAPGNYQLSILNTQNSCETIEDVTVVDDLTTPTADAGVPATLDCTIEEINLTGVASGQGNLQYNWTTSDGNIVSGSNTLNPLIDSPGNYLLTVTNIDNDCEAESMVAIDEDVIYPNADAGSPATLNCYDPTLELDGEDSSTGGNMQYQWSTPDGNILNGATTLTPEIDLPGTYVLVVTNMTNTCVDTAEVVIDLNNEVPIAGTGPDEVMGCGVSELELEGTANSSNPILNYTWTTTGGNIVSGSNTLNPVIDAPGTYVLTVSDPFNGCESSSDVEITQNTETPVVAGGPGGEINCTVSEITLQGTATGQTQNFQILWTTPDGNIVSGGNTLNPVIDAGGVYELLVTDTTNNCFANAVVNISEDADIPVAEVAPNGGLNCVSQQVILDATNSSQGAGISYEWTSPDGNFINGQNTLTPTIDQPGIYTLSIFDSSNDCESTTTINIPMDTLSPVVDLGGGILTCDATSITIDANTNLNTDSWTVNWTSQDGAFDSGIDSLTPVVSTPGTYVLQTLNTINGCTAETSVEVTQYIDHPQVEAEDPEILTCVITEVVIDASNSSSGQIFDYLWTTSDGNIVSGEQTLEPMVNEPGTYDLVITNTVNGCSTSLQSIVNQDVILPAAIANPSDILTCDVLELNLDGNGSEAGIEFTYFWSTQDGNILSDENTLNPVVNQPGTYEILVTNTLTSCTSTAEVIVPQDIVDPISNAGEPGELTCNIQTLILDGTLSSNEPTMQFLWTTIDGEILSDETTLNPTINQPGTYSLEVLNTENGCTSMAEVEVTQDVNLPEADAGQADDLTCIVFEVTLDGSNSQQGQNIDYQWTTTNGNIVSGANSISPIVDEIGTYQLTVTNLDNGCSSISNVEVIDDLINPDADAGGTSELNCVVQTIELDGLNSSSGSNYNYLWNTTDGNIVAGAATLVPIIDAPGTYEILVTNTINGCTSTDEVLITQSIDVPNALVANPETLTCTVLEIDLNANASSQGTDFSYQWTTSNGNILSGNTTLTPTVNAPGEYELLVTNTNNGCTNTILADVPQDVQLPNADAGQADDLTCVVLNVSLDAGNSSQGSEYSYYWETADGNIQSGANTMNPVVTQPGTYAITVTNTINGCTQTDNVQVILDDVAPIALVAPPDILTCTITEVDIDATASNTGPIYQYQWTTSNGNIIAGGNSLTPAVNEPGTYNLVITNSVNGCTEETQAIVNQDIELPIADAGEPFILNCVDDIQYLDGTGSQTGNISYIWDTQDGELVSGQTTMTPGITIPGTYNLLVTNLTNGCSSLDDVVVTEDLPISELDVQQPPCFGDKGQIFFTGVQGGTAPYVFSNDGGENFYDAESFTNLDPGQYSMIVQDLNGCEDEKVVNIYQPNKVVVDVDAELELQLGDTWIANTITNLQPNQISNISWTPSEGLSCDDCLNPVITAVNTTVYQVTVTNENGCEDKANVLVRVDKEKGVYIPNAFSPNNDGTNDLFLIYANPKAVVKIRSFLVFSRWGETVWQYYDFDPNDPASGWDGVHRGEFMNPAVFAYFAEIEFIDGTVKLYEGDVTLVR